MIREITVRYKQGPNEVCAQALCSVTGGFSEVCREAVWCVLRISELCRKGFLTCIGIDQHGVVEVSLRCVWTALCSV